MEAVRQKNAVPSHCHLRAGRDNLSSTIWLLLSSQLAWLLGPWLGSWFPSLDQSYGLFFPQVTLNMSQRHGCNKQVPVEACLITCDEGMLQTLAAFSSQTASIAV